MMRTCNLCSNWAQWRVVKLHRQSEEQREKDKAAKLAPAGPELEVIAFLCGEHKEEQKRMPEAEHLRFDFIGAVPCLT